MIEATPPSAPNTLMPVPLPAMPALSARPGLPGSELRAAPRSSLMLRTAKILCESGEYLCVVRDVSATGARLRLFHAAPPDAHVFLELANGDRYAMERVWEADDHAGFRFSCSIDVDRFIAEPADLPRRPPRLSLRRSGTASFDGTSHDVELRDLSQHGMRIEAARAFPLRQLLRIDVDGLPRRFGSVRWRRGGAHGVVLQDRFRLDDLSRHAAALQPFLAPPPATAAPAPAAPDVARRTARYG